MLRSMTIMIVTLASGIAAAQQQTTAPSDGVHSGTMRVPQTDQRLAVGRPAALEGTTDAPGVNSAGGVSNGPNVPLTTQGGNAGAGGGVSPAQQ